MINDKKKFRSQVLDKLIKQLDAKKHRPLCKGLKEYVLCGTRTNHRRTLMSNGLKMKFEVRMVLCKSCKQKFSLLPSFLPREKNFGIEIIANVTRNICLHQQSFQNALESISILGKSSVKSKQTVLNWLRWLGSYYPATVLTRAGIKGSGYIQEDEGFEKEPNLRTYSVIMVDPKTLVVWHADYIDHVDEETLCKSFKNFMREINFKILGATKDKWLASTNALKKIFIEFGLAIAIDIV